MEIIETLNITLDVVMVVVVLWMLYFVMKVGFGGLIGKTLMAVTIGAVMMGFSHFMETILVEVMNFDAETGGEFGQRLLSFTGFVIMVYGLRLLSQLRT